MYKSIKLMYLILKVHKLIMVITLFLVFLLLLWNSFELIRIQFTLISKYIEFIKLTVKSLILIKRVKNGTQWKISNFKLVLPEHIFSNLWISFNTWDY